MEVVRAVLLSTYELGRQPFGLASPAAWLREAGHDVTVADLSRSPLPLAALEQADLVAFFLPMHTATRLALGMVERVRSANPRAHLCGYGLYAPLSEAALRRAGVRTIIGGEFEQGLVKLARGVAAGHAPDLPSVSTERHRFRVPDRSGLPSLGSYARLASGSGTSVVGYTEASRGCKHLCRHCPVVPVYRGLFRIVQQEVVLEDIRRQVAAGAAHITFGDPDFFNGPGHAIAIVKALHREWPELTYDVTIKIEHLLRHRALLPVLKATGCRFVTSAVESFDDAILEKLAKGHTRADFLEALREMRAVGLPLAPTFIPFTPWTTMAGYRAFLQTLVELDLAGQVAPIQLAIRLLVPEGSLLLEVPEIRGLVGPFNGRGLCYPWRSADPELDGLSAAIQDTVRREERRKAARFEIFRAIWDLAGAGTLRDEPMVSRAAIPHLTEPWYC